LVRIDPEDESTTGIVDAINPQLSGDVTGKSELRAVAGEVDGCDCLVPDGVGGSRRARRTGLVWGAKGVTVIGPSVCRPSVRLRNPIPRDVTRRRRERRFRVTGAIADAVVAVCRQTPSAAAGDR